MTEPRSHVVWRHVHACIHRTGTSWPTLAARVRAHYEASVPAAVRRVEFSAHADAYERMRLDAQTLRRFEHDVRYGLPADLEEACVAALAEPWGERALAELASRYGLLAAPIPPRAAGAQVACLGRLTREFGELVTALAPAFADGRLDAQDRAHAKACLRELADLEAQCAALKLHLQAALAPADNVVVPIQPGAAGTEQ